MIARRLKAHRLRRGLSQRQLAELIGYPASYIARIETAKQRPSDKVAAALDEKLDTNGEFADLLEMARALVIEPGAREVLAKEATAERIRTFVSSTVPGLLQTSDYAHDLTVAARPNDPGEEIGEVVAARLGRQRKVFDRDDPPLYRAVIDEAALARPVGPDAVMAAQLRALLKVGTHHRNRVQILPFHAREYAMMGGTLVLLDLEGGRTAALVENFRTAQPVESPSEVVECQELFEAVQSSALDGKASAELIRRYIKEYDHAADD
jgi:transcriptional regulator with XRE-family HTH domain